MATRVTQVEKDLMWELYQKYGSFKKVADIMGRGRDTVSRYVHEREAAINAVRVAVFSIFFTSLIFLFPHSNC